MKSFFQTIVLGSLLFTNAATATLWVKSTEGYDCKITCSDAGWVTPVTDKYKGGPENFYVCLADYNNEGKRAGYSLSHEAGCHIVADGKDVKADDFSCMCG